MTDQNKYIVNIPAPEEVRTWAEYVKLFKSQNHTTTKLQEVKSSSGMNLKDWFNYCWSQDDAEMIYSAYNPT